MEFALLRQLRRLPWSRLTSQDLPLEVLTAALPTQAMCSGGLCPLHTLSPIHSHFAGITSASSACIGRPTAASIPCCNTSATPSVSTRSHSTHSRNSQAIGKHSLAGGNGTISTCSRSTHSSSSSQALGEHSLVGGIGTSSTVSMHSHSTPSSNNQTMSNQDFLGGNGTISTVSMRSHSTHSSNSDTISNQDFLGGNGTVSTFSTPHRPVATSSHTHRHATHPPAHSTPAVPVTTSSHTHPHAIQPPAHCAPPVPFATSSHTHPQVNQHPPPSSHTHSQVNQHPPPSSHTHPQVNQHPPPSSHTHPQVNQHPPPSSHTHPQVNQHPPPSSHTHPQVNQHPPQSSPVPPVISSPSSQQLPGSFTSIACTPSTTHHPSITSLKPYPSPSLIPPAETHPPLLHHICPVSTIPTAISPPSSWRSLPLPRQWHALASTQIMTPCWHATHQPHGTMFCTSDFVSHTAHSRSRHTSTAAAAVSILTQPQPQDRARAVAHDVTGASAAVVAHVDTVSGFEPLPGVWEQIPPTVPLTSPNEISSSASERFPSSTYSSAGPPHTTLNELSSSPSSESLPSSTHPTAAPHPPQNELSSSPSSQGLPFSPHTAAPPQEWSVPIQSSEQSFVHLPPASTTEKASIDDPAIIATASTSSDTSTHTTPDSAVPADATNTPPPSSAPPAVTFSLISSRFQKCVAPPAEDVAAYRSRSAALLQELSLPPDFVDGISDSVARGKIKICEELYTRISQLAQLQREFPDLDIPRLLTRSPLTTITTPHEQMMAFLKKLKSELPGVNVEVYVSCLLHPNMKDADSLLQRLAGFELAFQEELGISAPPRFFKARHSSFTSMKPETLRNKMKWMKDFAGLDTTIRFVTREPHILGLSTEYIKNHVEQLTALLEVPQARALNILVKCPKLLSFNVARMAENMAFLSKELDMEHSRVVSILFRFPSWLSASLSSLEDRIKALQTTLRADRRTVAKCFQYAPSLLGYNPACVAKKITILRDALGLSAEEAPILFQRVPSWLTMSPEAIQTRRDLQPQLLNVDREQWIKLVTTTPSVFNYNLQTMENKIKFLHKTVNSIRPGVSYEEVQLAVARNFRVILFDTDVMTCKLQLMQHFTERSPHWRGSLQKSTMSYLLRIVLASPRVFLRHEYLLQTNGVNPDEDIHKVVRMAGATWTKYNPEFGAWAKSDDTFRSVLTMLSQQAVLCDIPSEKGEILALQALGLPVTTSTYHTWQQMCKELPSSRHAMLSWLRTQQGRSGTKDAGATKEEVWAEFT